jgi:hypothetical protein
MFIVDVQNIQTSLDLKADSIVPTIPCLQHAHLSAGFFLLRSRSRSLCDWQSVSQSVSLGVEPHLGLMTRYLLLFDSYGLGFVGRPLWWEDGSVFCICCLSLPAQSLSGPSPLGLATIFYCLRFETSFSSPPTTRRVTVEVFDPASTRVPSFFLLIHKETPYITARGPNRDHRLQGFHYCFPWMCCLGNVC